MAPLPQIAAEAGPVLCQMRDSPLRGNGGSWWRRSGRRIVVWVPGVNRIVPTHKTEWLTVAGFIMTELGCQSSQTADNQAQRYRSAAVSFGRFTDRCKTLSW